MVMETNGSVENIQLLCTTETTEGNGTRAPKRADVAFVGRQALEAATARERAQIRVLSRLYTDRFQIVVRGSIDSLHGLAGNKVYIGAKKSGTRLTAKKILDKAGLRDHDEAENGLESEDSRASDHLPVIVDVRRR